MSLIIIIFISLFLPISSLAQSATPTINPKAEEIKKINEKIVQDKQGENTVISTTIPKSIVGTITKIQDNQITVNNNKNEDKTFSVDDETTYIDNKKNKIKFSNLKPGQIILSMGYYDQSANFNAKRIIVTSAEEIQNKNEIVLGTIVDISQTSNVLVLIPAKNKNTQYQIKTDSKSKIIDNNDNNLQLNKLQTGQKVVVTIYPDSKISNTFDVSKIIILNSDSEN